VCSTGSGKAAIATLLTLAAATARLAPALPNRNFRRSVLMTVSNEDAYRLLDVFERLLSTPAPDIARLPASIDNDRVGWPISADCKAASASQKSRCASMA